MRGLTSSSGSVQSDEKLEKEALYVIKFFIVNNFINFTNMV